MSGSARRTPAETVPEPPRGSGRQYSRPYYDRTADCEALMVKRNAPRWIRMLRRYGYIEPVDVELTAA